MDFLKSVWGVFMYFLKKYWFIFVLAGVLLIITFSSIIFGKTFSVISGVVFTFIFSLFNKSKEKINKEIKGLQVGITVKVEEIQTSNTNQVTIIEEINTKITEVTGEVTKTVGLTEKIKNASDAELLAMLGGMR